MTSSEPVSATTGFADPGRPLLQLKGVVKAYGATRALAGVDFSVHPGEIHALLGRNGSGKSTLMKIAFGEVQPDEGQVIVRGQHTRFRSPHDALDAGLAMVPQELPSALDLTVTENVLMGLSPRRRGLVDRAAARRRASELLAMLGADIPVDATVRRLTPHDRQLVAIAHALAAGSTILILDEPTSSLAVDEAERLFSVMRRLRDHGIGLVFITQRLREVTQVADRITVLRDGHKISELAGTDLLAGIETMVTGAAPETARLPQRPAAPATLLRVTGLADGVRLHGVDLTVSHGEIVGVSGLLGCGRTELLRTLFGVGEASWSGQIQLGEKRIRKLTPATAIRHRIALATADRRNEGLLLGGSVIDNLMMARRRRLSLRPLSLRTERRLARKLVEDLAIKAPFLDSAVATLSGGNQQKVVLGKWLALDPRLLLLDEPTRGIDGSAKADFHATVVRLAEQGVGVVVGSLDDSELLEVCHRIVVLRDGRVVADLDAGSVTEDQLLMYASGLERT